MKRIIIYMLFAIIIFIFGGGYAAYKIIYCTPEEFSLAEQISNYDQDWPRKDALKGEAYSRNYDGIDVSRNQGKIDWNALKRNTPNLQFIYIRAVGYGGKYDKVYRSQVEEAKTRGIPIGSYLFFTQRISARKQFEMFRKIVEKNKQDLRPVIDIEDLSLKWSYNKHLRDSVMILAKLMEKEYGCKPIIYSNESYYKDNLSPNFNTYPLWIAKYSCKEPDIRGAKPILWQKSEKGHVEGILTYVDLNSFINGGNINDLRR